MPSKRRLLGFAVVGACGLVAFVACTTSSRPPIDDIGPGDPSHGSAGATTGDAGVSCYGSDAGCSHLSMCGAQIYVSDVAQSAPAGTGGAITAGVYSMTEYTVYVGTSGTSKTLTNWFKETLEISSPGGDAGTDSGLDSSADAGAPDDGGAADASALAAEGGTGNGTYPWLDVSEANGGTTASISGSIIVSGTSLTFQPECGGSSTLATTYTSTASTIVAYFGDPGIGTAAVTYTLMP